MQSADEKLAPLKDPSLVLIFSYAPAGLGHLRVTDALYHGLPQGTNPLLLGSQDQSITFLHRLTSISRLGRSIGEWFQSGLPEDVFSKYYRQYLCSHTDLVYRQFLTLLDQHYVTPRKVLIVATHFSLAHQLGAIKERIAIERKIKIYLAVQVTDDSPQHIWYVPGADITFVPSAGTKDTLSAYGEKTGLPKIKILVNPYPLSPYLIKNLPDHLFAGRLDQLSSQAKDKINVIVPISGAAVGLNFTKDLMDNLHNLSDRFLFHIIARKAPFTASFLRQTKRKNYISVFASEYDRQVVDAYEKLYQEKVVAMEITKPSEQSFKALMSYRQIGGSVLLFTSPVGRQEYDNLEFLFRNNLVPRLFTPKKTTYEKGFILNERHEPYRGLCLPGVPQAAADFIYGCLQENIFHNLLQVKVPDSVKSLENNELGTDGVFRFWEKTIDHCLK